MLIEGRWYLYDLDRRRFRRLGPLLRLALSLCDGRHTESEIEAELADAGAGREGALSLIRALGEAGCLRGSRAGAIAEGQGDPGAGPSLAERGPWEAGAGPGELEVSFGRRPLPYRLSFDERGRLVAIHYGPAGAASGEGTAPASPAALNNMVAWLFGRNSPVSDGGRLNGPAAVCRLLPLAPRPGSSRALDTGAGSGYLASSLARRGWVPVLVDQAPVVACRAETARQAAAGEGIRAQRVVARLESLPFPDGSFELATCFYVLEHVAEPAAVLREIGRALAPGGHLVLLVPTLSAGDWLRGVWRRCGGRHWQHRRVYGLPHPWAPGIEDVRALPAQLRRAGFDPRLARAVWGARAVRPLKSSAEPEPGEGWLSRWLARMPPLCWLGPAVAVVAVRDGTTPGAGGGTPGGSATQAQPGRAATPPGSEIPVWEFWREVGRSITGRARLSGTWGLPPALALGAALDEVFGGLARHRVHLGPGPLILVAASGCPLEPGGAGGGWGLPSPWPCWVGSSRTASPEWR